MCEWPRRASKQIAALSSALMHASKPSLAAHYYKRASRPEHRTNVRENTCKTGSIAERVEGHAQNRHHTCNDWREMMGKAHLDELEKDEQVDLGVEAALGTGQQLHHVFHGFSVSGREKRNRNQSPLLFSETFACLTIAGHWGKAACSTHCVSRFSYVTLFLSLIALFSLFCRSVPLWILALTLRLFLAS